MLATSTNVLFPGHNHLLSTGGYDLKIRFLEVSSMVVTWWIGDFFCVVKGCPCNMFVCDHACSRGEKMKWLAVEWCANTPSLWH